MAEAMQTSAWVRKPAGRPRSFEFAAKVFLAWRGDKMGGLPLGARPDLVRVAPST